MDYRRRVFLCHSCGRAANPQGIRAADRSRRWPEIARAICGRLGYDEDLLCGGWEDYRHEGYGQAVYDPGRQVPAIGFRFLRYRWKQEHRHWNLRFRFE